MANIEPATRLRRVEIRGLFGLFDHDVEFRLKDRITIIHAPNGYGKTVLLKFIEGFFGGSLLVFRQYEYSRIVFHLTDGGLVEIVQNGPDDLFFEGGINPDRNYVIRHSKAGEISEWDPTRDKAEAPQPHHIPSTLVERYLSQFVIRISAGDWRDRQSGERMNYRRVLDRYSDYLPANVRRSSPHPEWLEKLRGSIHCQLIETQRLVTQRPAERHTGREENLVPAVKTYAEDLAQKISVAFSESASVSQRLEQTFPNRLLARMADTNPPPGEAVLRRRLAELEAHRSRLVTAGLIDPANEDAYISDDRFTSPTRKILSVYIEDTWRKLVVYENILTKVELFAEILNERLQFKSVKTDRRQGIKIEDSQGRPLDASSLSSGEQHELVLVYDLLFKTKVDTLMLIDEPEISLHIAWQRRFLSDLRRIVSLSPMDVVLSTHSPQIMSGNLDLAVQLVAPK